MTAKTKAPADPTGQEFIITREFDAPREVVFKAWTDPAQLAGWWGPRGFTNPVCEWDARPERKIYVVMRAPNGTRYPMGGEFREIVAPERLVFTSGALDEKGEMLFEFLHTATFVEHEGKTRLRLNSRVLKTTADAAKYIGGFEAGMTQSLEKLEEFLRQQPFVIERTFDAPAALVWRAITTREDMRRWYFDLEEFRPEVGFEFRFVVEHEGNTYDHRCKVIEVVPQQKIAYTWRYAGHAGDSLVTYELFADGNQTKLKLTHAGLETFPKLPSFARKNFIGGWTQLIGTSLKDYLETAGREIFITRDFNAPRELVWEAMTNPKHVGNWWGPRGFSTTIETMDFRVGGVWKHVMHGPDGTKYPNKSIFKEIVKPERIVFSHGGGREQGPGASFTATWSFEALGTNRTRVSARMVFSSPDERDFVVKEFGAIEGGKQTLERLGEHVAGQLCEPFVITREFAAPRERVWQAWTERARLMEWFGPKGFVMTGAKLDFRPGGTFHYALRAPDGRELWGKFVYREIVAPERILFVSSFSDEAGGLTRHPFSPVWPLQMLTRTTFTENAGKTTITIKWLPLDATDEERQAFEVARPSMMQGWGGTFEQLAGYLAKG